MAQPQLSIITVTYNAEGLINRTIESVSNLNFKDYEYIVIDGNSSDQTNEIISEYKSLITHHLIEPDRGIYDAMNKGVKIASGNWLIFMNAGDVFSSPDALDEINFNLPDIDIYYSDTILLYSSGQIGLEIAELSKHRFNHQSFIYKRTLHEKYGNYLCQRGVTISDYLFLAPIWKAGNSIKLKNPISIFSCGGISSNDAHFYQKIAVDILYGFSTPQLAALKLLVFPLYKIYKHFKAKIF